MNFDEIFYPEFRFGGYTDIDGTVVFFNRVNAMLTPSDTVLDVGCGRAEYAEDKVSVRRETRILKGKAERVIGIDVSKAGEQNPCIDEFRLISEARWPVDDNSVDFIVSDFVMEHIEDPMAFFSEAKRVLRPGGRFCIRTPNKWNYIAIASRMIPNRYHAKVTGAVQDGREEQDVFPTLYRCNSVGVLRKLYRRFGFDAVVYGYEAQPCYLSFSRIAYFLGYLHQKLAPRGFRATLFAFGRLDESKRPL
jgi:SAM-dependent methyltransferase